MTNTVGGVGYDVQMDADVSRLKSSLQSLEAAFRGLESTLNASTKAMDSSLNKVAQTASKAGKTSSDAFEGVSKKIEPTMGKLEDIEEKYSKIRQEAAKISGATDGFDKITLAMKAYKDQLRDGFESTSHMAEATGRLNREMNQVQQETNKYNSVMLKIQNTIATAEREVATLTTRMVSFGATEEDLTPLNQALERYKANLEGAGTSQAAIVQASNEYKAAINDIKNGMEAKGKSIRTAANDTSLFTQQLQNTTKAVQLALGPLSGIAARITAFTSLVKTNTVAIAAFTATITGIVVASNRVVRAGMEYERQLLNLQAAIEATGRVAEITGDQLDAMSRRIAQATLTNANAARSAINVLLTYDNLASDLFERIATTAQGIASAFGGDIVASTRLLARALEQPANSLDSLRRVGIQFTESQREQIRTYEALGQRAKAQNIILERTSVFYNRAQEEAKGLAGQLDAVGDNIAELTEEISKQIGTTEALTQVYTTVNEFIRELIDDSDRLANIISSVDIAISATGKAIEFLIDNFHLLSAAMAALFVGAAVKMAGALIAIIANMKVFQKETWQSIAAIRAKDALIKQHITTLVAQGVSLEQATIRARAYSGAMLAMRTVLTSVLPFMAALGAAMYLVSRQSVGNVDGAQRLQTAYTHLTNGSHNLNRANQQLRTSLGEVTDEMVKQFEVVTKEAEISYKAAERAMNSYYSSLDSNMREARRNYVREQSTGMMDAFGQDAGAATASQAFQRLQKDLEFTFKTIQSGGAVSEQYFVELKARAAEFGVELENIDKLSDLQNLRDNVTDAQSALEGMNNSLRDGAVDAAQLFSTIRKEFGELFKDLESDKDFGLLNQIQSLIDANDQLAEQMAKDYFAPQREAIKNSSQTIEEQVRQLSILDQRQAALETRLRNLSTEWQNLQNAQRNATVRDIAEQFAILEATIAGNVQRVDQLNQAISARNTYDRWINDLGIAEGKIFDVTEVTDQLRQQLQALGVLRYVDLSDIQNIEDLEAALMRASEVMAVMTTRANTVSREMRKTPAKELGNEFKQLASQVEEANKFLFDLSLKDVTKDYDQLREVVGRFNNDELTELSKKLEISIDLTKGKEAAVRTLTQAVYAEADAYRAAREAQEAYDKRQSQAVSDIDSLFQAMRPETIEQRFTEIRESIRVVDPESIDHDLTLASELLDRWLSQEITRRDQMTKDILTNPFTDLDNLAYELEQRRVMLEEAWGAESEMYEAHLIELKSLADRYKSYLEVTQQLGQMQDIVAQGMQAISAMNRQAGKEYQAFAAAQVMISAAMAVMKVWAEHAANPWYAGAMTAMIGATAGAQLASIKSQTFATGGYVSGAGTGTSDSIPAWLSNGEFVINAQAVKKLGLGNLEKLNQGMMPQFSTGGYVAPSIGNFSGGYSSGGGDVYVTIVDQSTGGNSYETSETISPEGRREIRILVRDMIKESMGSGELDSTMQQNYGQKRRGVSR
ncbi:putative tape measure protein [Nitrincola phage 1M3-16]|uniref:tail length tape measure protein n=1 Tax=Nitrincola phage 1M3-16 TaxID=1472912 RepID=UPI000444D0D4|nr:tail length tape measure protein [Nitrincola phage 1M3-16]AHX01186.1 putative tape measure protein [Nitrincola phage 1M3-16]